MSIISFSGALFLWLSFLPSLTVFSCSLPAFVYVPDSSVFLCVSLCLHLCFGLLSSAFMNDKEIHDVQAQEGTPYFSVQVDAGQPFSLSMQGSKIIIWKKFCLFFIVLHEYSLITLLHYLGCSSASSQN